MIAWKPNAPSCDQINRAAMMCQCGIDPIDFHAALTGELTEEGIFLAWCAGMTATKLDEVNWA